MYASSNGTTWRALPQMAISYDPGGFDPRKPIHYMDLTCWNAGVVMWPTTTTDPFFGAQQSTYFSPLRLPF